MGVNKRFFTKIPNNYIKILKTSFARRVSPLFKKMKKLQKRA
jgi:hypothetical protein